MRVLEPHELKKRKEQRVERNKRRRQLLGFLVACLVIVAAATAWLALGRVQSNNENAPENATDLPLQEGDPAQSSKTTLKTFKGDEFRDLYRSVSYPNTQAFSEPPEITGDTTVDNRIRALAEARGFVLTSIPISPIVKTNEPQLAQSEDDLLQPLALKAWQALKADAKKENIPLGLISAYRSPQWQRELFMQRLLAQGVTMAQLSAGLGDDAIKATLSLTAVPGYSRHHTGYTVDMTCDDGSVNFASSSCNRWLLAVNYKRAKVHGWIPSYPEDASEQGPEPESWEYVWVGTERLYE